MQPPCALLALALLTLRPAAARPRPDYRRDRWPDQPDRDIDAIVARVQTVLCDNFPSIPCQFIVNDDTLHRLIKKSITQINSARRPPAPPPPPPPAARPDYLPVVDSEDLSKFLEVKHTGYFDPPAPAKKAKKKWSKDTRKKKARPTHRGRSVIRTYYPHKIKYKVPKTFVKDSEETPSASAELIQQQRKVATAEPVWKIDYTKHGEPSISPLNYRRREYPSKMMKGINEDEFSKHEAREVMRSKMYINNARKSQLLRNNESGDTN